MAKIAGMNGLDIQRDYICVAQYDPGSGSVRNVAILPLAVGGGDGYWDAIAGELKGIRKTFKFTSSNVVCSLPCDMAVVKTLEADSDEPDQEAVLRWELSINLAGAIEDYVFDFYEVDPGHQAYRRRYLAAAIRKEALAKLKKAVKSISLNPYIVDIDLFALTNVFQSNYRERLSDTSILVLGEHLRTKMVLVNNSSYIGSCVVDFDADAHDVGEYIAMLNSETAGLASAHADVLHGGSNVYLAGALFTDRRFAEAVLGGVTRCELLDPFRKIVCAAGVDGDQLKTHSPKLAVAVGLALRGEDGI